MTRLFVLLLVATATFTLAPPQVAFSHGGEPRLEIGTERANPGAPLTIRGVAFSYEQAVGLSLRGGGRTTRLATVFTDVEGGFTITLVLPPNLSEGAYTIRAAADHHVVVSAPLHVRGAPVQAGQEDGSRREEEDSLLAPMPTADGATTGAAVASAGTSLDSSRNLRPLLAIVVVICVIASAVGIRGLQARR